MTDIQTNLAEQSQFISSYKVLQCEDSKMFGFGGILCTAVAIYPKKKKLVKMQLPNR